MLLLLVVGWSAAQLMHLATSIQTLTAEERRPMTTFTTNDVVNTSGTKANIVTTQIVDEPIATTITRHNAAVAAWKASATPD
jgi:hypothetical protein